MKSIGFWLALLAVPALLIGCPEPREPAVNGNDEVEDERSVAPDEEEHELTEQQRQQRQAYIDRVDNEIDRLEDQIDRLEDRLDDAPDELRTDVQPRVDALRGYLDDTRTRYDGWDEMTEQGFQQTRFDIDDRLEEARRTYQDISQQVDSDVVAPAGG